MRRSTIVPTVSNTTGNVPSANSHNNFAPSPNQVKTIQMNRLADQLSKLQANLSHLENHVHVTAIQAEAIRRMGALQAALFMASGRVMSEASMNSVPPSSASSSHPSPSSFNHQDPM
ncbi:DASH complex subunit Dad5 [Schizosaccharomyces cryophilus OY26]|uniref:DASH complex subunit Dad5 n=1 Tax=Schizosaccharomyces cryophilus (strain OY26 / ATCC MYA-4695 / CBS 11777 / NBRC 106824 / NRRL Y48691) TaxID=653667 RepID=S9VWH2_SCHCR|nr:DASH complex subunit Dad5 [Schizosaccharomyces cryophilus OY26]EPY51993.1 DASH complex subunit Dad5 [Schizosaccharomyces cryophilus OY26]